ncbi:hypothetical protein HYT57_04850 [Candidatus Woesearchaeota archaeon]|nr:hypothetical protein [Candidatus Woesearchaeota archaeon]
MPNCTKCGLYTKYEKGLCTGCYSENSKGLSKKETRYKESIIKGRIAETLIEELFLSLGYGVFRYGMENTIPGIVGLLQGVDSEVASNIRKMPDFVIQHPVTKEVYFIEVKFRSDGEFDKNETDFTKNSKSIEDYPYKNTYFIIVSKKHIKCITYYELRKGGKVTPISQNYLSRRKELELDKNTIIKFCKFAVKFFKEV